MWMAVGGEIYQNEYLFKDFAALQIPKKMLKLTT